MSDIVEIVLHYLTYFSGGGGGLWCWADSQGTTDTDIQAGRYDSRRYSMLEMGTSAVFSAFALKSNAQNAKR